VTTTNRFLAPPAAFASTVGPWHIAPGATWVPDTPSVDVFVLDGNDEDFAAIRAVTQSIPGSGLDFVTDHGLVSLAIEMFGPTGTLGSPLPADLGAASWDSSRSSSSTTSTRSTATRIRAVRSARSPRSR
jgi:hypothetical protein